MSDLKSGVEKTRQQIAHWKDVSAKAAAKATELEGELQALKATIDAPIEAKTVSRKKRTAKPKPDTAAAQAAPVTNGPVIISSH